MTKVAKYSRITQNRFKDDIRRKDKNVLTEIILSFVVWFAFFLVVFAIFYGMTYQHQVYATR